MIERLKYHARIELDNIRQPDVQFSWGIIILCVVGIIAWTLVMSP